MKQIVKRVVVMITFALLGVRGQAAASLNFVKPVEIPELGIKIKLMAEANPVPPPSPKVYLCEFRDGARTLKEDRYDPADLWRQSQLVGQWTGRHDHTLLLATMSRPCPRGFSSPYVSRTAYDHAMAGLEAKGAGIQSVDDVDQWVSAFTEQPNLAGKPVERISRRVDPVRRYLLTPPAVVYAFRVNRVVGGTNSSVWVCAAWTLNPALPVETATRMIETEFLPSVDILMSAGAGSAAKPGKPDQVQSGTQDVVDQVAASIRNMKGWWLDSSTHYVVLSNLKGNGKTLVGQLNKAMDVMWTAYAKCIPADEKAAVCVIRLPATEGEYDDYVGADNAGTGGLWVPSRKELVIKPVMDQGGQEKKKALLLVAFHEGFHQYAHYALKQTEASLWFNEGYAQFFQNAAIQNGKVRISDYPAAIEIVGRILESRELDLAAFLQQSREQFYSENHSTREANYALAWAFIYYLKKDPHSPFASLPDNYVHMIRQGMSAEEATARLVKQTDMQALANEFRRFWRSPTRQAAARRHDPWGV